MKSSQIKSFRFNQLLLLAVVVCMVVNHFNVVMAIQSNRTSRTPSLVLIQQEQQQNSHRGLIVNATNIKGYFWDFVKYFGIELNVVDVDIQIIDGKLNRILLKRLFHLNYLKFNFKYNLTF